MRSVGGYSASRNLCRAGLPLLLAATMACAPVDGSTTQEVEVAEDAPVETLVDTKWRVEDIDGGGVIDRSNVTLTFSGDGRVSGTGGCNRISGEYTFDGERLSVADNLAMTRRACAPALMEQDQRLVDALTSASAYRIDGGTLTITGADGTRVVARR